MKSIFELQQGDGEHEYDLPGTQYTIVRDKRAKHFTIVNICGEVDWNLTRVYRKHLGPGPWSLLEILDGAQMLIEHTIAWAS
jgi:hypothetical protein